MDISPLQKTHIDAANLSLRELAGNKNIPQREKIERASQEFEALLLRQILNETQRPVFPSKLVNNSTTSGIYRDMIVKQLAEDISRSGSLGLAKSLTREFQPQSHPAKDGKLLPLNHSTLKPFKKS